MRLLSRQAIPSGEVADLRAQLTLPALKPALGTLFGYQVEEKAPDQCGERSGPFCGLDPRSTVSLIVH
ncbi:MAG: hypothetical protein ACLPTZ_05185 [Beijerinckiaceae bacterium]